MVAVVLLAQNPLVVVGPQDPLSALMSAAAVLLAQNPSVVVGPQDPLSALMSAAAVLLAQNPSVVAEPQDRTRIHLPLVVLRYMLACTSWFSPFYHFILY